ncbi:MAG: DNA-directed RNA polymerase subunit alpha [Vampirovibrionales bacterium]|nr:DNA-directed RNA polymerase subunit alpha [Vampirovibrionales bacterium]
MTTELLTDLAASLNVKCVNTTTDSDGSIYGKFVLEPLARGYGATLGNALRRILLSSLPGSAITSLRIEGITHEFTVIPGVVEDVLDIILNLKGVVLKSTAEDVQYLRVDADKPGVVTAGDLQLPADVRVINPGWPICTLGEGASFHAELTCETGTGYVRANQLVGPASRSVDVLPIDATYMPIRRVAYNVEDTRVGQKTDYDKLTLEIWSDGSIDVSVALSQAANMLIEHLVPIASLAGTPSIMTTMKTEAEVSDVPETSITIEDLDLSVRAFNCLKRANIHNIQELLLKSEADLVNIKNFGKKSAEEVVERLTAFGLLLKPNPADYDPSKYADK